MARFEGGPPTVGAKSDPGVRSAAARRPPVSTGYPRAASAASAPPRPAPTAMRLARSGVGGNCPIAQTATRRPVVAARWAGPSCGRGRPRPLSLTQAGLQTAPPACPTPIIPTRRRTARTQKEETATSRRRASAAAAAAAASSSDGSCALPRPAEAALLGRATAQAMQADVIRPKGSLQSLRYCVLST